MNMDFDNFLNTIMDLKYSQRLNKTAFSQLFYPNSTDDRFLSGEWYRFCSDPLRFLWTLSNEELEKLVDYINNEKEGDQ